MFVAETPRGICKVSFSSGLPLIAFVSNLQRLLPEAKLRPKESAPIEIFESIFSRDKPIDKTLNLHLFALPTHINVWRTLLATDPGKLTHHKAIAEAVGRRKSTFATNNAIDSNPIAFFIPSHRSIDPDGHAGTTAGGSLASMRYMLGRLLDAIDSDILNSITWTQGNLHGYLQYCIRFCQHRSQGFSNKSG
jgi:O6-methylguanine-DNA--protein-cysteine methyltransferase